MLKAFLLDLRETRRLAKENDLSLLAASLSFFCLFSVVPFLIFSFLGAHILLVELSHTEHSAKELSVLFEAMFPYAGTWITKNLVAVLLANKFSGVLGIGMLGYSTYELFRCLHRIFQKISEGEQVRHPFLANLISLFCFIGVSAVSALAVFLFTTKSTVLKTLLGADFADLSLGLVNIMASAASLLCVFLGLTFLLKMLPTRKVRFLDAIKGSLLFLGSFLLGRLFYQFYIIYFRYMNGGIYGQFFKPIIFLAWVYFLSHSFLFAAQFVIFLQSKGQPSSEWQEPLEPPTRLTSNTR